MESNSKAVLDEMIKSVITRDGKGSADTMLVSSHLSQMKMFGIRQGVEFIHYKITSVHRDLILFSK